MENQKWYQSWVVRVVWVLGIFVVATLSWAIGNQDTAGYHLQIASLQSELAVSEQNYQQAIDALNEQNITHGLPVDDQIANLLEFLTDNGTVKYDITLSYHIDDDGIQSGDITIGLEKGDKINID